MARFLSFQELRDLEKHLKLDDTIIQHFVPSEAVDMIQKRATWDDQLDNWVLAPLTAPDADGEPGQPLLEPRPRCAVGDGPRPLCEYARIAAATSEYNNPRFRCETRIYLLRCHFMLNTTRSFYQGRLGTNIGTALKKRCALFAGTTTSCP